MRARGLLAIPTATPSAQQVLTTALRSPLVERGLGVRVASYARPAAGGKVRLLLAAEVARASRPVSVGFVLIAAGGKVVSSRLVEGLADGGAGPVPFAGEATVEPGTYTLRLAAVDSAGRRGSVHHETKAAVTSAGGLLISDLVLAPPGSGALRPVVDLEAGSCGPAGARGAGRRRRDDPGERSRGDRAGRDHGRRGAAARAGGGERARRRWRAGRPSHGGGRTASARGLCGARRRLGGRQAGGDDHAAVPRRGAARRARPPRAHRLRRCSPSSVPTTGRSCSPPT